MTNEEYLSITQSNDKKAILKLVDYLFPTVYKSVKYYEQPGKFDSYNKEDLKSDTYAIIHEYVIFLKDNNKFPSKLSTCAKHATEHTNKIIEQVISEEQTQNCESFENLDVVKENLIMDEDEALSPIILGDVKKLLSNAVHSLSSREAKILTYHFGLEDGIEHSYNEIGQVLDIDPSSVRHIANKALKKLRHPARCRSYDSYKFGLD